MAIDQADKEPTHIGLVLGSVDTVIGAPVDPQRGNDVAKRVLASEVDTLVMLREEAINDHGAGNITDAEAEAALGTLNPALLGARADFNDAVANKGSSS